ncbi:MAG: fibronectin type III domain-containing protein, partial [Deltaproteobacteria bacterium]|nr:fibronectin type III domain-containing protein [Deltaproteobacteria bacterium]
MLRIKSLSQYNSSQFTFFHPSLLKTLLLSALAFLLFLFIFSQDIFASQIRLAWDPNTESDLAGYKVYYGTASGTYGTPVDAGNVTIYTLTSLTLAQTYFVAVTAYD